MKRLHLDGSSLLIGLFSQTSSAPGGFVRSLWYNTAAHTLQGSLNGTGGFFTLPIDATTGYLLDDPITDLVPARPGFRV